MARDIELDWLRAEREGARVAKEHAKLELDAAWQQLQDLQEHYSPQISQLKERQGDTFAAMQAAFDTARCAYRRRDHRGARRHANRGKELRKALSELVLERRSLIAKLKPAQTAHDTARKIYLEKKSDFLLASQRFKNRLVELEIARRQIAIRAGVPSQFVGHTKIVQEAGGRLSLYFGGIGKPDGPGHAHYVLGQDGTPIWRREVGKLRGGVVTNA